MLPSFIFFHLLCVRSVEEHGIVPDCRGRPFVMLSEGDHQEVNELEISEQNQKAKPIAIILVRQQAAFPAAHLGELEPRVLQSACRPKECQQRQHIRELSQRAR